MTTPIFLFLRFGLATPTEVAVLSVVYSLALSLVYYRPDVEAFL